MPAVASQDTQPQSRFPGSERPRRFADPVNNSHRQPRHVPDPGAGTLDERISTVWSVLVTEGRAECPVCTGPARAAEPCPACGSELS